jgi:hypothetical protein
MPFMNAVLFLIPSVLLHMTVKYWGLWFYEGQIPCHKILRQALADRDENIPVGENCLFCMAVSTYSSISGTLPHPFTHCNLSLFPISKDWTPHLAFNTCIGQLDTPTCPTPTTVLLSFPTSYWLPDYATPLPIGCWTQSALVLQAYIYALFSTVICYTLKMDATKSTETLVSYHNTTWHYNPEDCNLYL